MQEPRTPRWLLLGCTLTSLATAAASCADRRRDVGSPRDGRPTAEDESAPPGTPAEPAASAGRAPAGFEPSTAPSAILEADLLGDGEPERVEVYLSAERGLGFLHLPGPDGGWTGPVRHMWKAIVARLDGTGRDRIVAGIVGGSRLRPNAPPQKTVWVLGGAPRGLRELWRGSRLSRPLLDVTVADADGDGTDELVALETLDDRCWVALYRWNGFGFDGAGDVPVPCAGLAPCPEPSRGCLLVDGRRTRAVLQDGTLSLVP